MNTTRTSENVSATPACLGLGRIARLPRSFWLALSLLAAALLCAPSPAAAHSRGGDRHGHFNISLTPSTITEGQTTTVSYSYSGPGANIFSGARGNRYASAYIQLSKSAASPTGGGAVNFGSNTRWSWQTYLENRHDNGLGEGSFPNNHAGTVTITPVDDNNVTGTRTVTVSGTLPYANNDYFYSVGDTDHVIASATLTILDNDAAISVSRGTGALALTEYGDAAYTVALTGQPTGAVVVDVTSDDAGAVAVAPAALTYSATTWNTGQAVTVRAVSDADSDAETVTVTHAVNDGASADEFDPAPDVTFTVNVTDRNTPRSTWQSSFGSFITGVSGSVPATTGSKSITIVATVSWNNTRFHACTKTSTPTSPQGSYLQSGCVQTSPQPSSGASSNITTNVSVTQAMIDNGGFVLAIEYLNPSSVVFGQWVPLSTPKTPTLVLSPTSITENGGVATVTATLSSAPTAAVTLTVAAAAVAPAVAGDFTLSTAATLTFAASATTSTGTVTLTAVNNAVFAADKRVTVTGTVASTDGLVVAPAAVTLTLTDDESSSLTLLRIQDRTPGRTGNTDFSFSPACCSGTAYTATVPATVTAVQLRVRGGSTHGIHRREGLTGSFSAGTDADHTLSTTGATVIQVQIRDGLTTVLQTFTVTIYKAGVAVGAVSGQATEAGGTATFTVRLTGPPSANVRIGVSSGDSGEGRVAPAALDFTTTTWNTAQTVTVTGVDDSVPDGTQTWDVDLGVPTSTDGNYSGLAARTVSVTTVDDEGLAVDPTTLMLTEQDASAGSGTYTVALATLPSGPVTVSVTSGDAAVTVAPTSLTYSATTWNTAQTVTATAVADADDDGETVTVTHAVSGTADPTSYPTTLSLTGADVTVTVTDDDAPGLVVSATDLTTNGVNEGSTATYTVRLNTQPTGTGPQTVTVTVSSDNADVPADVDGDAGNGAQTTLTYTTASWATAQAVTVRAGEDADAADDAVTWTHATSGADYGTVAAAELAFTVNDDETAGIEVDTAPGTMGVQTGDLVVTEEDATLGRAAYTVVLTAQPVGGAVTVGVASGDATEVTVAPAALVFNATNWNTARTVTATAVADADQGDRETVTVTHTVSGTADTTSYPTTLAAVTVTVQVRDDDRQTWTSSGLSFDVLTPVLFTYTPPRAQTVVVQGPFVQSWSTRRIVACAWTAVRPIPALNTAVPAGCTLINDRPNVNGLTLSSPITPTQAMLDNGGVVIGIGNSSTSFAYRFFYTKWVPLDTPKTPTLVLAPATITEAGGVATVTARLSSAPSAAVTLTVAASAVSPAVAGDFTLSAGPTLTFETGATTSTGTVTLTAVDNAVDAADKQVTVTGTVASTDDRVAAPAAVTLTITDDDRAGVAVDTDVGTVGVQTGALALPETGPGSGTYTVVLGTEPSAPVTVTITSDDTGAVSRAPGALTFGPTDWATAQTVVATAVADADAVDERVTLTHTLTGAVEYVGSAGPPVVAGVPVADVVVTVADAEEQGLTLNPPAVTVAEDGAAGTYTVVLDSEPTAPVVVRIGSDNTDVHAMPGLLQYTAISWETAQPVTVRADADADARADMATLTHTAAGGDYTGLAAETLAVTVTDTSAGVAVSRQGLTVVMGETNTYTIMLTAQPAGPVTVTAAPALPNLVTVDTDGTPESRALVFTAGNWQTPQVVTVTGVAVTTSLTLNHRVDGYGGVTAADPVSVVVAATGARLLIDPQVLRVLEGGPSGTYTVRLATDPTGTATVTVGAVSGADHAVSVSGAPVVLTFTGGATGNWGTAQPVTVTAAVEDPANAVAGTALILHTVGGYNGGTTNDRTVNVNEVEDVTPTLGAVAAQTYRAGQAVSVRLPGATGGNPPLRYALTGGTPPPLTLPTGLSFAAATRRLQGTPGAAAPAATYTLTVTDVNGSTATRDFALTVAANPLTFGTATVALQRYPLNRAIEEPQEFPRPTVVGNPILTFVVTPALPAGLTYEPPVRQVIEGVNTYPHGGRIVGTPTEATPQRGYTLTVVDGQGNEARLPFALATGAAAVSPDPGLADRQPTFGDAMVEVQRYTVGTAVTLPLPAATGGDPPLTYTLTPADVPAGLTYTPPAAAAVTGGTLTGTPTAVRAETTYTLTATDADGDTATLAFTVEVGAVDTAPTFGDQTVAAQTYTVGTAIPLLTLPAATDGDGRLTYTLSGPAGADPPAGLRYTPPPVEEPHGGTLSGTPTAAQAVTPYTLTATDADGDAATLTFTIAVVRTPVRVTLADASAVEGRPVEFAVTLSRAVSTPLTLAWTAGRPGSATPGEDYPAAAAGHVTLAASTTAGTLVVPTLDDRRVEPVETFTVTVTLPADTSIELTKGTAEGRIEDDDTEQARRRSLGMVLAGVGRTLATDAVDVIGDRFVRPPTAAQATVGGQAVDLERGPQRGRWRHAAGVAYGVARALGVEVGSPLEGGDGQFGQVRGAAWSTLTRHLRDPHAPTPPLSAWDAPGAVAGALGHEPEGPASAGWPLSVPPPSGRGLGGGFPAWGSPADATPFGHLHFPGGAGCEDGLGRLGCGPEARVPRGVAGYGPGLGQLGFDRAHAATPQAVQVGALRAPVQFRRVSGAEVLAQSAFELPLSRPAPHAVASATEGTPAAGPPIDPAAQAGAAAWTLWGRGTASGFNGKPKADFSMDGNVFTGYLGVDYRLQPNVLLGLAVAHSQGDVDYETADVTKGDVDVTLTSVLPYAHWSPRPGLGVWGLFGAGWGDLKLRDEAGRVKTDLELLLGAVGARQEVLTWRQIDVALKADAFLTELEAGSDDRLPETAGDAQRLRLMVEGRTAWALSEDSHLTPVFEVGGRWDGGKAETGVGAEMGGGLEYAHTKLGLGIEARGRYLLAHQKSAFDEWGASLTLRLDPGADKRGLWLALAPVWGAEASQVEQMWGSADVLRAGAEADTQPGFSPAQVEFDLGYGMVTHEGAGLLTTYGGLSMLGPESHGVRLGGRLALGEWVDLSVEGERTTQGGGAEHQVALYGHLGW